MPSVFISHVAEDSNVVRQIGDALSAHGSAVSLSPREAPSGDGTAAAIQRSDVVVLVISPHSLGAERLTNEIAAAAKGGKDFLPVLISLSHAEFADRAPEWQAAIGAASSVSAPPAGVASVLPRILEGVAALTAPRPSPPSGIRRSGRPRTLAIAALVGVVLAGATTVWAVSSRGGEASDDESERASAVPTTFVPGPLADAATTPLETSMGDFLVTSAFLTPEACSNTTLDCQTASGSDRYVVLTLTEADGRAVPAFTVDFRRELRASYVEFGDGRATYTDATGELFGGQTTGSFEVAYEFLPESAARGEVLLAWPGSPTLELELR